MDSGFSKRKHQRYLAVESGWERTEDEKFGSELVYAVYPTIEMGDLISTPAFKKFQSIGLSGNHWEEIIIQ